MTLRAVLFDFNGVLLWDSPLHERVWKDLSTELRGWPLTAEEHAERVHGHTNPNILEYILDRPLDADEAWRMSQRKEELYQRRCIALGVDYRLSPGAEDLLDRLAALGAPFTIATASEKSNVDFYFERLPLSRWFDRDRIAYDDGTIAGKAAPDLFLNAAKLLGIPTSDCIIVEDSLSGLQAARAAGAGYLVAV